MSRSTELERVAFLSKIFRGLSSSEIALGIGDDAAVLSAVDMPLVWTIDAQVEGTHFKREWLSWEDVGWRSFMAAASDLAAMGADPVAALSSLILTEDVDDNALASVAKGQADAARIVGAPVAGGNLSKGREASITTTLLGRTEKPVARSGACAGDGLFLAGALGLARAGWLLLDCGRTDEPELAQCIDAWRRPTARLAEGRAMRARAHAAIDVSDGLSRDVAHLARASSVRIVLEEVSLERLVPNALVRAAAVLGVEPLDLVLRGGEDYALLVTSPTDLEGFCRIGRVEEGASAVFLDRGPRGQQALADLGFDHFAEAIAG